MRIERALKIRDEYKTKIRDAYSAAVFYRPAQDEFLRTITPLLTPPKAPRWVCAYLQGIRDQIDESTYRQYMVHGGFIGDTFYSTYRDRVDYYETNGIEPSRFAMESTRRGIYWKETPHDATIKPFFV